MGLKYKYKFKNVGMGIRYFENLGEKKMSTLININLTGSLMYKYNVFRARKNKMFHNSFLWVQGWLLKDGLWGCFCPYPCVDYTHMKKMGGGVADTYLG